jgi:hypothetical protein
MNKILLLLILGLIASVGRCSNLAVSTDADYYVYYDTFTSNRTPFYVGINNQTTGSPYQYHFNVAGIEINDITNFNSDNTGLLKLNLQRFRVPVSVDPSYIGPPSYQYLTSGVTFTLKAVALTDYFSNIELASNPLDWYNNNLFNRPILDSVTFNQAGEISLNITSALNQWKINPLTNFGIGLIGTYSSIEGTTAQFYSTESSTNPYVNIIPEPEIFKYTIIVGIIIIISRLLKK